MANRLAANPLFDEKITDAYMPNGRPLLLEDRLNEPSGRRKHARIGVQFMGDLFHHTIETDPVIQVLQEINECPQHTFMALTKRPKRMREIIDFWLTNISGFVPENLWMGVSVENQEAADRRIPILLKIPAAVRWVSVEPMLGPVDLQNIDWNGSTGLCTLEHPPKQISWIVCGAETGPKKRRMNIRWAKDLRDQCIEHNVPYFFKVDSEGNRELDGIVWEEFPREQAERLMRVFPRRTRATPL